MPELYVSNSNLLMSPTNQDDAKCKLRHHYWSILVLLQPRPMHLSSRDIEAWIASR